MGTQPDPTAHLAQLLANSENSAEFNAYSTERQRLLDHEQQAAWDEPARRSARQSELDANVIIRKFREHERLDPQLFGNVPSEAVPGPHTRDMGGRFLANKDRIDRSRVFDIALHMPKGAHLHLHFNAETPPERLFPLARNLPDTMFVRSTVPLCRPEQFREAEIVFEVLPKDTEPVDLFAENYNPGSKATKYKGAWMKWIDFRHRFPGAVALNSIHIETPPSAIDGLDDAERWARDKMILTYGKVYPDTQTANGVWACFNQGTRAFKGLLGYRTAYQWYIGTLIDSMIRDKVMYAELRPMLLDKSIASDDGLSTLNHGDQMSIVCQEVERKQSELRAKGELDLFPFGLKIIYCTPRSIPRVVMQRELADCLRLKRQYPDLICGFDLVGAEDRRNHVGFYADQLVAFAQTCKDLGISIPFMFHAGESLLDTGGSHNPENSNLYDSLLLNAKRIGHGYSLLKHPTLVRQFVDRKICLELCPISNELLHLCGNIRQHIFPELLAAGLHCTLNADNPSLFRGPGLDSKSLSYEFYQVMVGDPRMSIHGWKQLAKWSIEHSCLNDGQRGKALEIFGQEWDIFCTWVVDTYGAAAEGLEDLSVQ